MHHLSYIFILLILSSARSIKVENDSNLVDENSSTQPSKLESTSELNVEEETILNDNANDFTTETSSNQKDTHNQQNSLNSPKNLNLSEVLTEEPSSSTEFTTTEISTETPTETTSSITTLMPKKCVFYRLHNQAKLDIEPNLVDLNLQKKSCLKGKSLESNEHQHVSNGTLSEYKNKDNVLQIQLNSDSSDSFTLKLFWLELNSTVLKSTVLNYGILLTIYEDLELIGKIFITDKLMLNKTKEIKFRNLGNLRESNYSIGLSKVEYFQTDLETYLKKIHPENQSNDLDFYLIKNVYQSIQSSQNESMKLSQQKYLNSNSQIIIYTIGCLLLLALVISLLYYRRDKFKSLINNRLDTMPSYQNSKYVRKSNNPVISTSHFQGTFSENPFEKNFSKNITQSTDYRNNYERDKLSLSKSGIGRVFEQSVATIKKRTTLKSISPSTVIEFQDLKKIDSRYSNSIALIEFLPLFNELIKTNNQRLYNEFMELDILTNSFSTLKKSSNKVARFSKNLQKNKDGSILPYDHSRVVLEKNRFITSNYINASFIPGCNSNKEYIACQCPLRSTMYAFWLMCIQQNVKYIIMTTQLIDSFVTMDRYWPDLFVEDGESIKHIENITIKLINKRKFNHYTVRIFEIKMNDECRLIKHFQLNDWTDMENHQNITMITEFLKAFRDEVGFIEINNNWNDCPIVVHCSNGIGKTAVLIAIDRLFVQLKKGKNDYIDIFGTVIQMRQFRPSMIQNQAQYKLIYECVAELVRKMYPSLVKQMEFDKTLDEINLNERNDFDLNNNLDSSNNSQIFLILKNSRPQDKLLNNSTKLGGYTNQMFVSHEERS